MDALGYRYSNVSAPCYILPNFEKPCFDLEALLSAQADFKLSA
jgi:hypothetical protein